MIYAVDDVHYIYVSSSTEEFFGFSAQIRAEVKKVSSDLAFNEGHFSINSDTTGSIDISTGVCSPYVKATTFALIQTPGTYVAYSIHAPSQDGFLITTLEITQPADGDIVVGQYDLTNADQVSLTISRSEGTEAQDIQLFGSEDIETGKLTVEIASDIQFKGNFSFVTFSGETVTADFDVDLAAI